MREALEELLRRVEACEGPDREIDFELGRALGWRGVLTAVRDDGTPMSLEGLRDGAAYWAARLMPEHTDLFDADELRNILEGVMFPRFTSSLDAAKELVEKTMPGWRIGLFQKASGAEWEAVLGVNYERREDQGPHRVVSAVRPIAPLALLAALLKANLAAPLPVKGEE